MFAHACKVGLEGVVSKVRDSAYTSGRGNNWVKKTCVQRETLTIAGSALDGNKWDGIYVGRRKGKDLIHADKVDHGSAKLSLIPSGSLTRASGWSRSCSSRSSTGRSRPRAR
jgi:bifunctional non-homologous end joining protein LigD